MMICHQTKSACRRIISSKDIPDSHILASKIASQLFAWHSGSQWCTITPSLVPRGSEVLKIPSRQSPDTQADGQKDRQTGDSSIPPPPPPPPPTTFVMWNIISNSNNHPELLQEGITRSASWPSVSLLKSRHNMNNMERTLEKTMSKHDSLETIFQLSWRQYIQPGQKSSDSNSRTA